MGWVGNSLLISHKCSMKFMVEWYEIKLISGIDLFMLKKLSPNFSSLYISDGFSSFVFLLSIIKLFFSSSLSKSKSSSSSKVKSLFCNLKL